MSSECKGLCDINRESQLKLGYKNGQKYCKKCEKYFLTDEIKCKCCKNKLRCSKKYNKTWKDRISSFVINDKGLR